LNFPLLKTKDSLRSPGDSLSAIFVNGCGAGAKNIVSRNCCLVRSVVFRLRREPLWSAPHCPAKAVASGSPT